MMWIWLAFIAFVLLMLALDLGVFRRKAHVVGVKEALAWSAVWLFMGLSFSVFVYFAYDGQWLGLGTLVDAVDGLMNDGATATEKYLTGYVVEKSLSVDNMFVIAMIFGFFAVRDPVEAALVSRPSTRSRRFSPSQPTPSWFSPATCSQFLACGRSTSRWPGW